MFSLLDAKIHPVEGLPPKKIEQLLLFSDSPKNLKEFAQMYRKAKGARKVRIAIAGLLNQFQNSPKMTEHFLQGTCISLDSIVHFVNDNCHQYDPDDIVTTNAFNHSSRRLIVEGGHIVGTKKSIKIKPPKPAKSLDSPDNPDCKGILFDDNRLKLNDVQNVCAIYAKAFEKVTKQSINYLKSEEKEK